MIIQTEYAPSPGITKEASLVDYRCMNVPQKLNKVIIHHSLGNDKGLHDLFQGTLGPLPLPVQAARSRRSSFGYSIPKKAGPKLYRNLRWIVLSTYRRLFTLVALANTLALVALVACSRLGSVDHAMNDTLICTSVNLVVSVVIRHEHFVNLLFVLSCSLPLSAPLIVRRYMAKVYSYGGLHSGCGLAAIAWYVGYSSLVCRSLYSGRSVSPVISSTTFIIVVLLLLMAYFALPIVRSRMHNWFEVTHRFAGWTVVGLFWIQVIYQGTTVRLTGGQSRATRVFSMPAFWCLVVITSCIFHPWARLRRRQVTAEHLSNHALRLHFDYSSVSYGQALKIGRRPLREMHAFAVIPEAEGPKGFSMVISNAGDWTRQLIRDPPRRIWTRGVPQYGVLRVAAAFQPVVIVATGSGIGPCLSFFLARPNWQCRILWSTSSPVETYGQKVVSCVERKDPGAVIVDTRTSKRPDLTAAAYELYKEAQAEAVVVISNARVTRKVIYGLESRGVPAYGPIFDS